MEHMQTVAECVWKCRYLLEVAVNGTYADCGRICLEGAVNGT
jgi:hypothetical protein